MKPPPDVYLSEPMAARLTAAAARTGATKLALIETALDRFLEAEGEIGDSVILATRLTGLSRQLEHLGRDLRLMNETVALHARFHFAVTPAIPIATQRVACELGSERFEEFVAQVGRRVDLGTSLMRETMDRLSTSRTDHLASDGSQSRDRNSRVYEPDSRASVSGDSVPELTAAVREDGSSETFPEWTNRPVH